MLNNSLSPPATGLAKVVFEKLYYRPRVTCSFKLKEIMKLCSQWSQCGAVFILNHLSSQLVTPELWRWGRMKFSLILRMFMDFDLRLSYVDLSLYLCCSKQTCFCIFRIILIIIIILA